MSFEHKRLWQRLAAALLLTGTVAACTTLEGIDSPRDISLWGDTVAPRDLPPAVTSAIRQKFPDAEIHTAERERLGDRVWYEVRIRGREGRYEVQVSEGGVLQGVTRLGV
jgi:hypothetical protein